MCARPGRGAHSCVAAAGSYRVPPPGGAAGGGRVRVRPAVSARPPGPLPRRLRAARQVRRWARADRALGAGRAPGPVCFARAPRSPGESGRLCPRGASRRVGAESAARWPRELGVRGWRAEAGGRRDGARAGAGAGRRGRGGAPGRRKQRGGAPRR